ncbi:Pectinesterase inhibitor [Camellia lanceoleosa]|uniref:Pectinesterase inhibitor n=1 Tax=Camellia lanceoleosa TaxID=1840588 RepID=A0ACC0G160_9ERIC|nr:Pectinesterase inhibitor [Camellia lanceoleosa]
MTSHISIITILSILLMFPYITTQLYVAQSWDNKITYDKLKDLCSNTQNSSFCFQTLKSNPRIATTNLRDLAAYTINLTSDSAQQTLPIVKLLAEQATDPQLNARYTSCVASYDTATGYIATLMGSLGNGDYHSVLVDATLVMLNVGDCEQQFNTPPVDPSQLPERNRNLFNLASIVAEIALELLG